MKYFKLTHTHGWTAEELEQIEKQTKDVRQRERLSTVHLAIQGYHVQEIARILSRTRQTISTYLSRFEEQGMAGLLQRGASSGKPPRLSFIQQEELKQTILIYTPKSLGLGLESCWHTRNIQEYIQHHFEVRLSREAIRCLLHRLGFRYTRPTYQLRKADPDLQAAFQHERNLVKKLADSSSCVLMYLDETHIQDQPLLHTTWQPKGQQTGVKVEGRSTTMHLYGALNAVDGYVHAMAVPTCNAQTFETFLRALLEEYEDEHLLIILDNARFHHATCLQPFLEKVKSRVTLWFLPPYSPQLNLIERVWKWLKQTVVANCYYATPYELFQQIELFLQEIAKKPKEVLQRVGAC
jgi:transposase